MKIAMLQLNFTVGDISGNAKKIIRGYKSACRKKADLVVLTELALFGYPPKDLLFQKSYLKEQDKFLKVIKKAVGKTGLIIGIVERNKGLGKPLFNSAVLIQEGKIIYCQRKKQLPNYDVFDENRYFEPSTKTDTFMYKGKKIAMLICEDIWNTTNGFYQNDPIEKLKGCDLDCLIVVNASPYYWGKNNVRYRLVSGIAAKLNCSVVYVNQVGGNDDLVFDGTSFAINEKLELLAVAKSFQEDLVVFDLNGKPKNTRAYHFDDSIRYLYDALVMGTRDYVKKSGFKNVVIPSSGGIDSALTVAIAVEAVGAKRVFTYALPSEYSSSDSVVDARTLAHNFKVGFSVLPIKDEVAAFREGFRKATMLYGGVAEENIQARIRGVKMMFISNTNGAMVLTTGNKSEVSVGYCTLYGDMVGGFAVISDVYKTLVYKLSNYVNQKHKRDMIPQSIINKEPSAELRPGQKDTDSLPPYEVLDEILRLYVENLEDASEIVRLGFEKGVVERIIRMVNRNEHKRRQMAPGLKVTTTAFGTGRRLPIAAKFL